MKTLKSFIEQSHVDAKIIRSVVKQIGGWADFKEIAEDVARYGANAGWVGFTYHSDTIDFTKRNKQAIIKMMEYDAESFDCDGVISFLAGFNCLKGETQNDIASGLYSTQSDNRTMIYNAMAWYCLEGVCRSYSDLFYNS